MEASWQSSLGRAQNDVDAMLKLQDQCNRRSREEKEKADYIARHTNFNQNDVDKIKNARANEAQYKWEADMAFKAQMRAQENANYHQKMLDQEQMIQNEKNNAQIQAGLLQSQRQVWKSHNEDIARQQELASKPFDFPTDPVKRQKLREFYEWLETEGDRSYNAGMSLVGVPAIKAYNPYKDPNQQYWLQQAELKGQHQQQQLEQQRYLAQQQAQQQYLAQQQQEYLAQQALQQQWQQMQATQEQQQQLRLAQQQQQQWQQMQAVQQQQQQAEWQQQQQFLAQQQQAQQRQQMQQQHVNQQGMKQGGNNNKNEGCIVS